MGGAAAEFCDGCGVAAVGVGVSGIGAVGAVAARKSGKNVVAAGRDDR